MKEIVEKACLRDSKVLILAHRRLLLSQHSKIIKNARLESVFTEVNHLGEHGKVDLIIIDEAHISAASTYQKVCDYYDCPRILFTATAKRLDNKPLNLCDVIINGVSAEELINRGLIAEYDLYAPKLNIDLNNISMSGSDFNNEELSATMCDKKIYGDIIKYYRQLADGKQALAYCVDVKHSKSICELFNNNNIPAKHIDSNTPEKIREQIIEEFQTDKESQVMILSLKAGGTGLNLTSATNVIHYDLWWNPAVEEQATDRTYRIGQDKNVLVHRMITLGTFEEKIDEMLKSKKELADLAVYEGEKIITELSDDEIYEIFTLSA